MAEDDVDSWAAELFAIEDIETFRRRFGVILSLYGAKYGGTPGVQWRHIPPHIGREK